jgi:peptidoglycan/xylan/chitin deacetylase (PgdA/CDA1 family)
MDMNQAMYKKTVATNKKWYDPALFSYLEQNNIEATFFVSGLFVVAYPDLIKNLASSSNYSFQNHSYDESSFVPHCYWLTTLTSTAQKVDQIQLTEDIIRQTTGQTAAYFRFPGICHSVADDTLVKSLGYTINDGSVIPSDPFNTHTAAMVKTILTQAADGATIIMHVGGPNAPKSLAVLRQIVPKLKAEGYVFAKL